MGRFSKLETDQSSDEPQPLPGNASGLELPKVRKRGAGQAEEEATESYDRLHYEVRAEDAFYEGDYQQSLRLYSRAMSEENNSPGPWVGQVLALSAMKQYREAAVWASRAAAMFPQEPRILSVQGLTLACNQAPHRAIACSDTALKYVTPDTESFVWAVRGRILGLSENANATFCLDKAMQLRPHDDWKIAAWIGLMLLDDKKYNRAGSFLAKAVEANPGNAHLWRSLGIAYERSGLNDQSMKAFQSAMEINPNDRLAFDGITRLVSIPLPVRLWRKLTGKDRAPSAARPVDKEEPPK